MPKLIGRLTIICRCSGEVVKVGCSSTKFIPHIRWCIARYASCMRMIHDCMMEAFSMTIVGGSIRGCEKMKNSMLSTEVTNLCGREFPIVSYKAFEEMGGLKFDGGDPLF